MASASPWSAEVGTPVPGVVSGEAPNRRRRTTPAGEPCRRTSFGPPVLAPSGTTRPRGRRLTRLVGANGGRVAAIHHSERRVPQRGLERPVVDELCPGEPANPLPGPITGEAPKVHDDDAIGRLRLTIRLRMKGRRHVQLATQEAHELPPERLSEDGFTIGDHRLRHAMEAHDVGEERLRHGLRRIGVRQRDEMAILAKTVHHGEDHRFPRRCMSRRRSVPAMA